MRKYLLLTILLSCLHIAARGQTIASLDDIDLSGLPKATKAKALRYWFDDDGGSVATISQLSGKLTIDVSALLDGLHTLHFQVIDENDDVASVSSAVFIMLGDTAGTGAITATKLMYWFDDNTDVKQVSMTAGVQMLDASQLTDGVHTIHYQALCSNGDITPAKSSIFMRMNLDTEGITAKSLRYWFDNDAASVRVVDVANGTQTLDVSNLLTGIHTLNYQLIASDNKLCPPVTRLFFKDFDRLVAEGENRVTKYQYWLNSNSAAMQTVTLNNAANPYNLVTLLPMQKEPIHSDCFHFEIIEGVPMMYAKNVFHVRFHDAAGYFADSDKPFIDYSVSKKVEPVGDIQPTQAFARVADNSVRWYALNVERGDTVAFKTTQACTMQLFSPTGKEVYNASGSASVSFGGCHTWENGIYYLAVHDVTGSQSQMTLDFMHMEKYDVVRQDVSVVGNGGCSTITFDGNGFKDLYAVDLFNAKGDSIHHIYIGHESDATTSVTFDFTGARLGKYSAVFHFADEDKVFNNIVTVEEAKDIELATTVTYPSTFLRGTSTTYTIKITNKGNMTAYAVPLEMHILIDKYSDISEIKFDGYLSGIPYPNIIQTDSVDEEAIEVLLECLKNTNGLSQFVCYHDSTDNKDYALSHAILTIPPGSTKQITVSIKSNSSLVFEAYTNKGWFPISMTDGRVALSRMRDSSMHESMCCMRTKVECVADIVVNIASPLLPPGANCLTSLSKTGLKTLYDVWCTDGGNMADRFDNYLKSEGQNLANRLLESAIRCVTGYYGKWLKELRKDRVMEAKIGNVAEVERLTSQIGNVRDALNGALKALYGGLSTMILGKGCVDAFTKPLPGCPPNPGGGGGSSTPVQPVDPNDIYGYTAESGSHAVRDGLRDVYYRIEFENDTTFATASAHDIYLTDTLDTKKFDLSTFAPTRVKIGSKSAELTGEPNSVTTVDMRPEINAIAQVESSVDQKKGIVSFHISSLDPMTMEPTKYLMDGVLPVNYDGSGLGEVSFDIQLRDGLKNGTEIPNRAGIVFDNNDVIMTPTWTNIVDRIPPVSRAESASYVNDSTVAVSINASDNLSGPWRYDVYVQYDSGAWFLAAENVPMDSAAHVRTYKGITHRLYTVCTDEAGNVENKQQKSELSIQVSGGVVTAVESLPEKEVETESGDVYDLQGRKSNEAQAGKGIIIKNRKKVAKY